MQLAGFLFKNTTKSNPTKGEFMTKHLLNKLPLVLCAFAVLLGLASTAYGRIPSMDVTVFDAIGKVAFKGPMSANATFATRNLPAGNYVVQFNTKSAAAKENLYLLVISAGKKKVIAAAVPEAKFTAGGVAMKIDVGPGTKITGQVANEQAAARGDGSTYRVIDGKRYLWVSSELGSNLGGRWVEEGTPPALNINRIKTDELRKWQGSSGEGSMITYAHRFHTGY
jgi:hypothetical protein